VSTRPRSLPLALYAGASGLLEPLAPAVLQARARRGKEDPHRLAERLGRATRPRPAGPMVWLHGVSVGESLSLLPLIAALRAERPGLGMLVTSGTVTSAKLLADRLPAGVIHQFAPIDGPRAVGRFLDYWRPRLGVMVESELWPNLICAAAQRAFPLALLSARITESTARGWGRAPATIRALLGAFDLIQPQDAASDARLQRLGARTGPTLNLKRLGEAPPADPSELRRLSPAIGSRQVVLGASTHPGEEALVAAAWRQAVTGGPPSLLILAPRHPHRGAAIAAELRQAHFEVARRSAGEALTPSTAVYLADTLGELGLWLRLAQVAVIGGGFIAGPGGHNPMEAARVGKPVITGSHVANAEDIYREMFDLAAAIEAPDIEALARHIRGLLHYPSIARRIGEAGLAFARRQDDALERTLVLLRPLLPA
jgi:3-deoxy-D-manno-octulosonic-acid transferase